MDFFLEEMGGNFLNCGKIFTLQNKIVRIMTGAQPTTTGISNCEWPGEHAC
jgi:hypothetical protein